MGNKLWLVQSEITVVIRWARIGGYIFQANPSKKPKINANAIEQTDQNSSLLQAIDSGPASSYIIILSVVISKVYK